MSPSSVVRPVLARWPGRLLTVGRTELYVRRAEPNASPEASPDEPALCVHGLGGSSENWTDLMGGLRGVLDAEALDLPGFGQSPPPRDRDYSVSAHTRAVIALLQRRVAERGVPVHLIGNSLGGLVSTRVAALRPDLVRTLTLISPALPDLRPRRTSTLLGLYGVPGLSGPLGRVYAAQTPQRRVAGQLALIYARPELVSAQRRQDAAAEFLRRDGLAHAREAVVLSLRGVLAAYLERGPAAPWRQAAQCRCPTLLVYGQRDKLVDPRTARRAHATYPDARLVVLPGSGHVAMMEHPRVVAAAIAEFLRDLRLRRSSAPGSGIPGPRP
jgi:pimeloyl-ACP methyl ester carboxylesterase